MSAIPYESEHQAWEDLETEPPAVAPRRRRFTWGKRTAVLMALAVGAICFYAGVRVEKGQVSSSSTGLPSFGALRGTSGGATSRLVSGPGFFAGAGGGGSVGTVSSISGRTLYLKDLATGNVVKVKLSGATKVTKNESTRRSAIRPGDSIVVQGVSGSAGSIIATSVSDSGPGSNAGGGGATGAGGSGSALNSLFQSAGG